MYIVLGKRLFLVYVILSKFSTCAILSKGVYYIRSWPAQTPRVSVHHRIEAVLINKLSEEYQSFYGMKPYFLKEIESEDSLSRAIV